MCLWTACLCICQASGEARAERFERECQTVATRQRGGQTHREAHVQMARPDLLLDTSRDRFMSPRTAHTLPQSCLDMPCTTSDVCAGHSTTFIISYSCDSFAVVICCPVMASRTLSLHISDRCMNALNASLHPVPCGHSFRYHCNCRLAPCACAPKLQ